ncbi:hypothetical protein [Micromonospora sediminicola]|uniref:hypothetical protein n=1 Tax=Micromonospora sediminicola TaxID=946078 RepID=UPI0037AE4661
MERRTIRRSDLLPYVVGALLAPIFPIAMVVHTVAREQPGYGLALSLAISVGGLCIAYLAGPAATFTVLPTSIRVANPFIRFEVPRHLFEGFDLLETVSVRLLVQGSEPITVQAALPGLSAAHSRKRLLRGLYGLQGCIDDIPPRPSCGGISKRMRLGNIAAATSALAAFFGAAWYVVANAALG